MFGFIRDPMDAFGRDDPRRMPVHFYFWSDSLDYESAVRADIAKQNYSICPRYWYLDATSRCRRCGASFVFSADEQRFWYEELRFWVDSVARDCPSCRRDARSLKTRRQEYDREIAGALARSADLELKERLLCVIGALSDSGVELPEAVRNNAATLQKQIERACKNDREGEGPVSPA